MAIKRQNIRKSVLATTFLLFEYRVFHLFFSPVLLVIAASQGIINGSLLIYGLLFIGSLFMGRAWCGWVCPGCAVNEAASLLVQKRPRKSRWFAVKYAISAVLLGSVVFMLIQAGGVHAVHPFFGMSQESTSQDILLLFGVVVMMVPMTFLLGRQAHCHYFCWQAPIMILGTKIKDFFGWPSVHIQVKADACRDCGACDRNCTMGLKVSEMVKSGVLRDSECILCGNCEDHCPNGVIKVVYGKPVRILLAGEIAINK